MFNAVCLNYLLLFFNRSLLLSIIFKLRSQSSFNSDSLIIPSIFTAGFPSFIDHLRSDSQVIYYSLIHSLVICIYQTRQRSFSSDIGDHRTLTDGQFVQVHDSIPQKTDSRHFFWGIALLFSSKTEYPSCRPSVCSAHSPSCARNPRGRTVCVRRRNTARCCRQNPSGRSENCSPRHL